jgi:subtilisin-like proprotein convertase family protein
MSTSRPFRFSIAIAAAIARLRRTLRRGTGRRLRWSSVAALAPLVATTAAHAVTAGTWVATTPPPDSISTMLLLTDGSVMAQQNGGAGWYRLAPNTSGSYASGTWSSLAPMHDTRLYFASAVLRDGRVFVAGGEYGSGGNTIEIYDPPTNTWSYVTGYPGGDIKDSTAVVMNDGRVLLLPLLEASGWIWNPDTGAWSITAGKLRGDINAEESYVHLRDGSFLAASCETSFTSQRYQPVGDHWLDAGSTAVDLLDHVAGRTSEIGAAVLLYDGRAITFGGTGHTAYFNGSSWQAGPNIPSGNMADDTPAAVMPNGHVLVSVDRGDFTSPSRIYELDPSTNTYAAVPDPSSDLSYLAAYNHRMLVLPSGQVMWSDGGSSTYLYTPVGGPSTSWRPTISSIAVHPNGSALLTGTQLNGLTEGASYGDDAQMASNYPIVRLTDSSNHVYYARTSAMSTMGLATGSTPVSCEVSLRNIPNNFYQLAVVANGVASDPTSVTVAGNRFASGALVSGTTYVQGYVFNDANADSQLSSGEAGLANWRIFDDQNNNGVYDTSTATIASTDVPVAIADLATTTSDLFVSGQPGMVNDVKVTLQLRHTFDGDLVVTLINPYGMRVPLFSRIGGDGDNFTSTVLSATAGTPIASGSAPYTGTFRPLGDLTQMNGLSPNGIWTLEVVDAASGDVGTIDGWSLTFALAEPSTLSFASGDYAIAFPTLGASDGNHILREQLQSGWTQSAPGSYLLVSTTVGSGAYGRNFGNYKQNHVTGNFWNDANRNAVKDADEANLAGWVAFADLDNDGVADSGTISAAGDAPVAIPDLGEAISTAYVSGASGAVTDVDVKLNITHTFDGDLEVYLTSPSGQRVELIHRIGASGDNFTGTTLNDEAATRIDAAAAPYTGSFKPMNPLSAMDHTNPNGAWTLEVFDRASGDTGTLDSWSVSVSYAEPQSTSDANGNYSIAALGNGTFPIRETVKSGWLQTYPTSFFHSVTVANGGTVSGKNFGDYQLNAFAGNVFNDLNANGAKDAGEAGLANWRVFVDTNANGTYDSGSTTRASSDVPKAIPDLGTATSSVTVSGIPGVIKDLNVNLSIIHTYDSDLRVYLIAPTGRRMELIRNIGGSGDNFSNTTLDDEAGTSIASAAAPFTGTFKAQSSLSAVDGISPNGTWRLEVRDTASSDTGTLSSWSLLFTYAEASALSNASGDYTIGNVPAGSYRLDEVVPSGWFMTTPTAGYFPVTVGSGTTLTGKNFGDRQTPSAAN